MFRSDRMKLRREARDLSPKELAALAECSENLIFRLEAGDRNPSAELLGRLAKVLRTTTAFLTSDEEMAPAGSNPTRAA